MTKKESPYPLSTSSPLPPIPVSLPGSVTEEDGSFHLPPVAGEDCLLKATYIGYRPQIIPCRQQNTIRLQPDTELLKEVVITASRPLIERKDGTLTANIAGTPLSLMGSAKEMISHLPFVTGSDGEFTVLGRGTPEIYINGRKVRDKTELDRLQANEILSAEIITTPGVQYGSSVGAVIRLRTIRKRGQGMSGSFYTDYSQGREPIGNEGISLNYRTGGLDIFVKRRLCGNQQLQNGYLQPGHLCFIQLEPIDRGQKQTNLSHLQRRTGIQLRNRRRPIIRHALHARHEHRQCTYYQ
ncbi:carboxypeptidase-like regulatory domain-containing protein [Bacteroides thetaiotaomicron]|nr:carboxypeptidase-like regulatory domain-containing protein [Bacteroides thetaiotaomicron]